MKKGFLLILMMFFMRVCYGEIEYTYEKASDKVLKILEVETTTRISETNITIKSLRVRIANLEGVKANALTYYDKTVARINKKISFIETQIDKAVNLGVIEVLDIQ